MSQLNSFVLILSCFFILTLSRKWTVAAIVIGLLYTGDNTHLEFAGYNLFPSRLIIFVTILRAVIRGEFRGLEFCSIDKILIVLVSYTSFIYALRTPGVNANSVANIIDVLGSYLSFKAFVKKPEDIERILKTLAIVLIPYVSLLLVEKITLVNPFLFVDGENRQWFRGDGIRCWGSFRHPSLLGSLGATFLPLYISKLGNREKKFYLIGCILCGFVIILPNSGGPVSAFLAVLLGWSLCYVSKDIKKLIWGAVVGLFILSLFMKAPIWFLIARISGLTGGGGYHRSIIIDSAIRDINDWWLWGMDIAETRDWTPYTLSSTGGADITNLYVWYGIRAGILATLILILLLVVILMNINDIQKKLRLKYKENNNDFYLVWGLGVVVFVHFINWFGITYFDKFMIFWTLQFAWISNTIVYYKKILPRTKN